MLLANSDWARLYSETAAIETNGPETLRGWMGQRASIFSSTLTKPQAY